MLKLNLGAGSRRIDGYVNVDRVSIPGIDVVWDLDTGPWPWADGEVSAIVAKDVFEHVNEPILFMTECHRVLRDDGRLSITTPFFGHVSAFTDPTHKRFPTPFTFDYWVPGTVYYQEHNAAYGAVAFDKIAYNGPTEANFSQRFELRKLTREEMAMRLSVARFDRSVSGVHGPERLSA